jgi:hypothetical protein
VEGDDELLVSLIAGLVLAGVATMREPPKLPVAPASSICGAGKPGDRVEIRVFPVGWERRVFPSPKEIMEKGGSSFIVRSFWAWAARPICEQSLPVVDPSTRDFLPRIAVFVAGEEDREPLLLEYPSWDDHPAPVRGRVDGKMVMVPAATVRRLLDYSRGGWTD